MWKHGPNKYIPGRIGLRSLIKYSCAEVSGPSEVPWFVQIFLVFKEVKLVCVRLIIKYSRVQVIAIREQHFL